MAERKDQNWERRDLDSRGPNFRIDVNNPQMGAHGPNVYMQYAVTDEGKKQFNALGQDGTYMVHNEKSIELVCGSENTTSDATVKISSVKGDITITVVENGDIKIKGGNIVMQSDGDIDLKAGRNINLNAGQNVMLKGMKAHASALTGNLVHSVGSWAERVFAKSKVGADYLANPPADDPFLKAPVIPGIGDISEDLASFAEDMVPELESIATDLGGQLGGMAGDLGGQLGDIAGDLGGQLGDLSGNLGGQLGDLGDLGSKLKPSGSLKNLKNILKK